MRCVACDCVLQDSEIHRKGLWTGEYLDLCDKCYEPIADDFPLATGVEAVDDELRDEDESDPI